MDALERIVENLVRQNELLTQIVRLLLALLVVSLARLVLVWWRGR